MVFGIIKKQYTTRNKTILEQKQYKNDLTEPKNRLAYKEREKLRQFQN